MTAGLRGAGAVTAGLVAAGVGWLTVRVRRAETRALASPVASRPPGARDRAALVVFGGRVRPDGPCAELRARLDHARRLWLAGAAPLVAVSGGLDGDLDEVAAMADYLVRAGLPPDAVRPARPGGTTRETMRTLRRQADRDGLGPFVAVSSAYHARRILDEARRLGLDVVVSAPTDAPENRLRHVRRVRLGTEVVATVWYALPDRWTRRTPAGVRRLRHTVPLALARLRPEGRDGPERSRRSRGTPIPGPLVRLPGRWGTVVGEPGEGAPMRYLDGIDSAKPLSRIGLGTWQFGSREWGYGEDYDATEAGRIVARAVDLGITVIDTAEVYGFGASERIVGAALRDHGLRDQAYVATKIFPILPIAPVVVNRGRASAGRLGVDTIDLYQVHQPNPVIRDSQTMPGMRQLVDEGVVRDVGVSNYSLARWKEAELRLGSPVLSNQVEFSLAHVDPVDDLVPYAASQGRVVIAFSPLGQGFLSGRYSADNPPPGGVRGLNPLFLPEGFERAAGLLSTLARGGRQPRRLDVPGRARVAAAPAQRGRHPRRVERRAAREERRRRRGRPLRRRGGRAHGAGARVPPPVAPGRGQGLPGQAPRPLTGESPRRLRAGRRPGTR